MTRINPFDLQQMLAEYPSVPTKVLAAKYGLSETSIRHAAKYRGIKKDFDAQRIYRDTHDKNKQDIEKRIYQAKRLTNDYPYYSNRELAIMYDKSIRQIADFGRRHRLKKDSKKLHEDIIERDKRILAGYSTRPTFELAEELGMSVDAIHKRAQRAGLHKSEDFKPTRKKRGESKNTKLIKTFGRLFDVCDIAKRLGVREKYVISVLHNAGITPIDKKPKKVVVQWSKDGKMLNRFDTIAQAGRSIDKKHLASIYQCCSGKKKSAYGYRWTIEII